MPELPEVETVVRSLQVLLGETVESFEMITPSVVKCQEFAPESMKGLAVTALSRRGKYIIMELTSSHFIILHLGMSGRLYLALPAEPRAAHTHAVLITDGERELRYVDPRRFGGVWLVVSPLPVVGKLGPEPLGGEFDEPYLRQQLERHKTAIKNLLLNQGFLAGVGNIYADEILHRAGIRPDRPANSLSCGEQQALLSSIKETLEYSISRRGTTFRDYRDGFNLPGENQNHLRVYGREGQPCPVCQKPVCRIVMGNRSSHFCEHCQH
jgi:formamidopyrimidine-DNA glycosylase